MVDGAGDRVRTTVSDDAVDCPRCGRRRLQVMRSRDVRAGRAKFNPFWDAREKTYQRCASCGYRRDVEPDEGIEAVDVAAAPAPVRTALGWALVVLLAVLVVVMTVVLAAMLLVVSVWLAVAVPVVVLAVVVAIAAYARRA